ncbi:hypothetical protein IQ64_38640 [Streptomyces stelliscabiei]|nr:hypothetical protein IQ64_38640 [Streptomyces stelliscabiei]
MASHRSVFTIYITIIMLWVGKRSADKTRHMGRVTDRPLPWMADRRTAAVGTVRRRTRAGKVRRAEEILVFERGADEVFADGRGVGE